MSTSTQCCCKKKENSDEAIGRSRGGLSTKIHTVCDANGNPTAFFLTAGQCHDLDGADALIDGIEAEALLADKAYDAKERVLDKVEKKKCNAVIPPKSSRKTKREYDKNLYKLRHKIENFFARLKQYRAIATRYDKTARNFLGGIFLAASILWVN